MRRVVLVSMGMMALGGGCSLITDLDPLSGDAAVTSDAPSSDAPPTDGGTDATSTGNLLGNPGFEDAAAGCGAGWSTANSGTLTRVDGGHSGASACMVCGSAIGSFNLFASPRPVGDHPADASYFAEAYFAMVPDAALKTLGLELYEYYDGGGGNSIGYGSPNVGTFGWQDTQAPGTTMGGVGLGFEIHASVPDGAVVPGCFVIDDAVLVQQ